MKKVSGLMLVMLFLVTSLGFTQARVVAKEWTIPLLDCLTGPIANFGELYQWAADRAASEINAAGGIKGKPVKIVAVDTASDPQKGSTEMARLVKDTLVALGPIPEPVILAAMPIAVENEMVSITATTSYEYAMQFFPWTVSWFQPTEKRIGGIAAAWGKQYPKMKKVVQFLENYGPFARMADAHAKGLTGLGVTMLPDVEVPTDVVTFGTLVVKALEQKPDGIVIVTKGDKAAKIIQELKNRGWKNMDQILAFSSADVPELYTAAGNDVNGVTIYNYINLNADNPRWNAVKEAYTKSHHGSPPPSLITNYYDAVYMIKEAIEKTAIVGDPKKLKAERKMIADYIANVKGFKGLLFDWDMKDGIPTNKPNYLCTIQDGKKINIREIH